LLRLVEVAQQYGEKKSRLIDFLKAAAKQRVSLALHAHAALGQMLGDDLFSYRVTRAQVEFERLQAEEHALTAIADAAGRYRKKKTLQMPDGQQYFNYPGADLHKNPGTIARRTKVT
jgi:hypothetical protein